MPIAALIPPPVLLPLDDAARWLVMIALAYVFGAIPNAVLIARAHGIDILKQGSGNPGATNVGRTLGRRWGVICFVLDALKGALPVLVAGFASGLSTMPLAEIPARGSWSWLAVAAAALAGHMASVFIRFRGGKGIATGFGALLAMWPMLTLAALLALLTWIGVVKVARYVSLASILAAWTMPIAATVQAFLAGAFTAMIPAIIVTSALALLVTVRHRSNLARLRAGTEPRIGASSAPVSSTTPPAPRASD